MPVGSPLGGVASARRICDPAPGGRARHGAGVGHIRSNRPVLPRLRRSAPSGRGPDVGRPSVARRDRRARGSTGSACRQSPPPGRPGLPARGVDAGTAGNLRPRATPCVHASTARNGRPGRSGGRSGRRRRRRDRSSWWGSWAAAPGCGRRLPSAGPRGAQLGERERSDQYPGDHVVELDHDRDGHRHGDHRPPRHEIGERRSSSASADRALEEQEDAWRAAG